MTEEVRKAGYFSRMPTAAILDPWLPPAALHVLSVICVFVSELGEGWPSIPTIATGAGCSERTVQRMLKVLESRGYISIRRTKGGSKWSSNLYQVNYPEVRIAVTPMMSPLTGDTHDVTPLPSATVSVTDRGDSHGVTIGVTKSGVGVTAKVAHEQPILNSPKEQPTPRVVEIRERKNGVIVYENGEWEPDTTSPEGKSKPDHPLPWWYEEDARQGGSPIPAPAPKPAPDPLEGLTPEERRWSGLHQTERQHYERTSDIRRWNAFMKQLGRKLQGKAAEWPTGRYAR